MSEETLLKCTNCRHTSKIKSDAPLTCPACGTNFDKHLSGSRPIPEGVEKWPQVKTFETYADALEGDSEVARLNQPKDQLEEAIFGAGNCRGDIAFNNHCGSCARCKSYGWTKAPDKDAIIRELVGALEEVLEDGLKTNMREWRDKARGAVTLARTTCPEAFGGCYENSTS